jgi:hypothetical protein
MGRIGVALVIGCLGAPTWARAQASSPQASSPQAAAQGATAPEATKGVLAEQRPTPLPGVTVTGRRLKPCAPRDQACIDDISKEIWARYPKQIETLCTHESIHDLQQGFQMEQLGMQTNEINTRMTPQTQALCQYGAKMKRQAKQQAEPTPPVDPDALPKP